jgi:hypothetical protein
MRARSVAVAIVLTLALSGQTAAPVVAGPAVPLLVSIRAAHHPGFDRIVFEFAGRLPERTTARWTDRVTQDPSDLPVDVQGNAFIRVVLSPVRAHHDVEPFQPTYGPSRRAYDLPNIAHLVAAGDFEAVVSFGVGLMKRTTILRTARLHDPSRFVIDVSTRFRRDRLAVHFADIPAWLGGTRPFVRPVTRSVPRSAPARSILARLFAGPMASEEADGLLFVASGATGFRDLRISDSGIARVRLAGGCDSHGSELTVADLIMPTLRQLPGVDWIKIYSPDGRTARPWGPRDSVPACLEP